MSFVNVIGSFMIADNDPYQNYSIDDDILHLIDEVDIETELKEIAEAIADTNKFPNYVREKSAKAVSKFLVSGFDVKYLSTSPEPNLLTSS